MSRLQAGENHTAVRLGFRSDGRAECNRVETTERCGSVRDRNEERGKRGMMRKAQQRELRSKKHGEAEEKKADRGKSAEKRFGRDAAG